MNPLTLSNFLLILSASSLVTAVITASSALTLAPSLLSHLAGLEDALEGLKTDQIVLAAVRMRSLVPEYTVTVDKEASSDDEEAEKKKKPSASVTAKNSDDSDSNDSDSADNSDDSDSDSDYVVIPNYNSILINSLNSLLKSLPSASKDEAMQQIFAFDFNESQSMAAFLAEKENEGAQKLAESIATIRSIQASLQSTSTVPVTVDLLARVVAKLDSLEDVYEEFEVLQQKSSKPSKHSKSSSKPSKPLNSAKQQRAAAKLIESRAKITKIVLKLAEILDETEIIQ